MPAKVYIVAQKKKHRIAKASKYIANKNQPGKNILCFVRVSTGRQKEDTIFPYFLTFFSTLPYNKAGMVWVSIENIFSTVAVP